jgi:histidinol-phosphatase (PHP family)
MVERALELGFDRLGFSGHSPYTADTLGDYFMNPEIFAAYRKEILALRDEYRGRIKIYLGIEQDIISPKYDRSLTDYRIGSVHTVEVDGKHYEIDSSPQITERIINTYFGTDYDSMAENYFALTEKIVALTDCEIIGHIDLISKYNDIFGISESERYLAAAERAVKALVPYGRPFEINTGAISRGYRRSPYPSPAILKMIKDLGGSIAISSDCHSAAGLDCAFDKAEALAKAVGFDEYAVIGDGGIEYIKF